MSPPVERVKNVGGVTPADLQGETVRPTDPPPPVLLDNVNETTILDAGQQLDSYIPGDSPELASYLTAELPGQDPVAVQFYQTGELNDFQVAGVQGSLTAPTSVPPKGACDVPQDGYHVKQVDYVRPFKIIGTVIGDADIKITGKAEYWADAERSGEWKITQKYIRSGEDVDTKPVNEKGFLETKQQVIVDKVMYGPKQVIEADIGEHWHKTLPVYHWETNEFHPTGPMKGKCGTLKCHIQDKEPKHYEDKDYCKNVEIKNVKLDIKPIREVQHQDFKQYKLHVDPSIPRLCENSLPKGLLKAMAANNISVNTLFDSKLDFKVIRQDEIDACETQTIARQNFELKYDEVFEKPWTQNIKKVCTKEWTQKGLETGKGTYEQLDGAKINGYYIQPGAEVGQINTYIRQHDLGRTSGPTKTTEHRISEVKDGKPEYKITKINDWVEKLPKHPTKLTWKVEKVTEHEKQYTIDGLIENEPKYQPKFYKCPLLKVKPNNPCKDNLSDDAKDALKHPSNVGGKITCIDKVPDVMIIGKCTFQDGKLVPALTDGTVKYAPDTIDDDNTPDAIKATLMQAYRKEYEEAAERQYRSQDLQDILQQLNQGMQRLQEQYAKEVQKGEDQDQIKLNSLQARIDSANTDTQDAYQELNNLQADMQKQQQDVDSLRSMILARAGTLPLTEQELIDAMEEVEGEVNDEYRAAREQYQKLAADAAIRGNYLDKAVDDDVEESVGGVKVREDACGNDVQKTRLYKETDPDHEWDVSDPSSQATASDTDRPAQQTTDDVSFEGVDEFAPSTTGPTDTTTVSWTDAAGNEREFQIPTDDLNQLSEGSNYKVNGRTLVYKGDGEFEPVAPGGQLFFRGDAYGFSASELAALQRGDDVQKTQPDGNGIIFKMDPITGTLVKVAEQGGQHMVQTPDGGVEGIPESDYQDLSDGDVYTLPDGRSFRYNAGTDSFEYDQEDKVNIDFDVDGPSGSLPTLPLSVSQGAYLALLDGGSYEYNGVQLKLDPTDPTNHTVVRAENAPTGDTTQISGPLGPVTVPRAVAAGLENYELYVDADGSQYQYLNGSFQIPSPVDLFVGSDVASISPQEMDALVNGGTYMHNGIAWRLVNGSMQPVQLRLDEAVQAAAEEGEGYVEPVDVDSDDLLAAAEEGQAACESCGGQPPSNDVVLAC